MSHFAGLSLENFRIFQERTDFEFAPITVLTGTNGSGKSSLIKALKLVQANFQKMQEGDFWEELDFSNGDHQLGSYSNAVCRDNPEGLMAFHFPFELVGVRDPLEMAFYFEQDPTNNLDHGRIVRWEIVKKLDGEAILSFRPGEKAGYFKMQADFKFFHSELQFWIKKRQFVQKGAWEKLDLLYEEEMSYILDTYGISLDIQEPELAPSLNNHLKNLAYRFSWLKKNHLDKVNETENNYYAGDTGKLKFYNHLGNNIISHLNDPFLLKDDNYPFDYRYEKLPSPDWPIPRYDYNPNNFFHPYMPLLFYKALFWEENQGSLKESVIKQFLEADLEILSSLEWIYREIGQTSLSTSEKRRLQDELDLLIQEKKNRIDTSENKEFEELLINSSQLGEEIRLREVLIEGKPNSQHQPFLKRNFIKSLIIALATDSETYSLPSSDPNVVSTFSIQEGRTTFFPAPLIDLLTEKCDGGQSAFPEEIPNNLVYFFDTFLKDNIIKSVGKLADKYSNNLGNALSSVRTIPERYYRITNQPNDIATLLVNLEKNALGTRSKSLEFLNHWLSAFNLSDSLSIKLMGEGIGYQVVLNRRNHEESLSEQGHGYSQFLPILLNIIHISSKAEPDGWNRSAYHPTVLLIEEPETNLHPKLQSLLADFFVDASKKFNMQFILETHSEYLIRKLQVLTAQEEITPDDTAIYYFFPPDEVPNDRKQVERLHIGKDGGLDKEFGPGFFDEALNWELELIKLKNRRN